MILDSQRAMRRVRGLKFCYLCGQTAPPPSTRDHVPPNSLFLVGDRDFPLILPTHATCNHGRTGEDQLIGQLVGILHKKAPDPVHSMLNVVGGKFPDGSVGVAVRDIDLRAIIRRWVRGFHAALYEEFQPDGRELFMTSTPLPEGRPNQSGGVFEPLPAVVEELVKIVKRNRATGTLDRILCRNGKMTYECVWAQADRGQWTCVYALDIYGWIELGDTKHFEARGCVGVYRRPQGGTPPTATTETRLVFPISNVERLDPFGQ